MTEPVTLTLYGLKDGNVVTGQVIETSVEALAFTMLANYKESDSVICRVPVDMLNYGAAVQTAFNHNAAFLPNTNLGEYASLGTATDPELSASASSTGTGSVKILQTSISMQSKVEIQFAFSGNISAYTPKAVSGGKELTCVVDTEVMAQYGLTVVRVAIGAANMRENVSFALYNADGNPVTVTQNVSVEALVKNLITTAQAPVINAMMRYGDAVAAYAASLL
jgi:hypothetical protein